MPGAKPSGALLGQGPVKPSSALLVLTIVIAVAATAAAVVYSPGRAPSVSPLRDNVPLSAFVGGVALAFSRPFLLVSVPFLTVLFKAARTKRAARSGPGADWAPPITYVATFALAFVVTISGAPGAIAAPIHRSDAILDPAGGVVFLVAGVMTVLGLGSQDAANSSAPTWRRGVHVGYGGVLGAMAGAVMYHELDPAYDSVFFATANAVAASHAPATVALFTLGLGITHLAAGMVAIGLIARTRRSRGALAGGRALSGAATALIGLALLTGRFGAIRGLLV